MSKSNQKGFTILELMIATMVFTVVFLGATTAILQIGKLYYKGVVTGRTQEVTRSLTDSVSQQLQLSDALLTSQSNSTYDVTNGPLPSNKMQFSAYCIGNTRYSFVINAQVSTSATPNTYDPATNRLAHALWQDTIPSTAASTCTPANLSLVNPSATPSPGDGVNGQELLGAGMRLSNFVAACQGDNKICKLDVAVIYGDNDLLAPDAVNPTHCASIVGSQWCATSQLSTAVLKRVGVTN
jgi:prepilin-type N-terminal cleavage/methylation domain-containing protein